MSALNLQTIEIKAFVPAKDFKVSKDFYQAIGFVLAWSSDDLAYFHHGSCSFLLQNFYRQDYAENFMMHLMVQNADDWHRHLVSKKITQHFNVSLGEPADRPWQMRDFTLHDPCGVLWRIGHNLEDKSC